MAGIGAPPAVITPSGSPVVDTAPNCAVATYSFDRAVKNRWTRRARPTRMIRRPVANGSSVPAWPALRTPRVRRTTVVMSCEVFPAGLSARTIPSISPGTLRAAR